MGYPVVSDEVVVSPDGSILAVVVGRVVPVVVVVEVCSMASQTTPTAFSTKETLV